MINYHNKIFKPVQNSSNRETFPATTFHYTQEGTMVSAAYAGEPIVKGHLLGLVDEAGGIRMHYHQINNKGMLMTGRCTSTPEMLPGGKIRLHEAWRRANGDYSAGSSVLEEP
ncbi:hypothetical protein LL912_23320 [Niabella sp. CC-SYL272]|uniref:hypothetical protein n=1 Tax=Niabella agricola TaxID=2891571 RepID=UPI001F37ECC5|nr:hypothetical protein [Niabella agricola]MCF3111738.1 hypothetical protein [Niabella agricola]